MRKRVEMHRLEEMVRLHRHGTTKHEVARMLVMSPNTERVYRGALVAAGLLDGAPNALPSLAELRAAVVTHHPPRALPGCSTRWSCGRARPSAITSHADFLFRLLLDEVERRDAGQLEQRVRRASFERQKTVDDFDFSFNPKIPKAKVTDLATCVFVARKENALLIGHAGVGKSHIAQAVGHRACRAGHAVLYVEASDMLKKLRAARADGSYDRRMLRFTTPALLIIDDLRLRPLTGDQPGDLYEIIRHRHERGSTLITTNRSADEIPSLFGDPLLASAAMDRLLHNAHVLTFEGESYRNSPPNRRRSASQPSSKETS